MNDKFTPLHNDMLEKLIKIRMSCYEWQILLAIFRKTYGFVDKNGERKKIDYISNSQISEMTKIAPPHVARAIKKLLNKNLVTRMDKYIGFNKEGLELPEQVIKITQTGNEVTQTGNEVTQTGNEVTQTGNEKLPKQVYTKERKENVTKETCTSDFDIFWNLYDKKLGNKIKLQKKWEKLTDEKRQKALDYIPKYKESQPYKQYRKHPETFLNNESWNDELIYHKEEIYNPLATKKMVL